MKKSAILFAAAAVAAIPLIISSGGGSGAEVLARTPGGAVNQTATTSDPTAGITVQGVGRVRVEPDTALVNVGVEVEAATVSAARDEAAEAMEAVVASVLENGVEEDYIQTVSFTITPRYDYHDDSRPTLSGYIVANTVSVTVRNLDGVGDVIDDAVKAGGDAVRINGVQFTVEDTVAAVRQARSLAVAFAEQTAQQLAADAGVTLGTPVTITESSGARGPVFDGDDGAGGESPGTPVYTGTETIEVTVSIRFAIE